MQKTLAAFLCLIALPLATHARSAPDSFADLVEKLSPAVVNISTKQTVQNNGLQFQFDGLPEGEGLGPFRDFLEKFGERFGGDSQGAQRDVTSLGSGFVIDPTGYIVTNNHVIEKADEITVTFQDETQYDAALVGRDAKTDLALLKIDAQNLPHVSFGSSDEARVGDWVIAIGNPFGLGGSVSAGIVSARSRNINAGPFDDFIQTDAAINRGNSGGPLFNLKGEVVGVNSAIFSPSGGNVGIGFSIPSALAEPVLKQLREFGRTHRGWLGVKIQHVTDELAEGLGLRRAKGALVLDVTPDSPADDAGVNAGDVILEFDGKPIEAMRNLPRIVAETKIGKEVEIVVWRDERSKELDVTLGEMDEGEETIAANDNKAGDEGKTASASADWMGAEVATLSKSLRARAKISDEVKGVIILGVTSGTAAFDAKLMRGDVIVQANQQDVTSVKALQDAINDARKDGKSHALLRINRRGSLNFTTIATKEK